MSSGFVSAGTDQEPVERDDEWLRAQQELEEERRRKAELGKQADGKSLYEVLQQNKMAKQEAFEEKIKLKNQFRSLDEDEVEFLDSIMESTRAQEAAVKKETAEQLEAFRRHREEAEKVALEEGTADVTPAAEGEDWKIPARKRRRDKKDLLLPGKKRKSTAEGAEETLSTGEQKVDQKDKDSGKDEKQSVPAPADAAKVKSQPPVNTATSASPVQANDVKEIEKKQAPKPASISLGLSGYSSDSE
ncbi:N-terminal domain of NEFA-interacting nuclear protein NIP30-domain-containing protein [Aspergillus caelatus]|uniref:N-terminal domain of NEFA-interacting nuclear protein NIP30-domain-containing protein n=2 Tax=Aspergillus subgen. Circumdati TaxID=2720871 RepID=A0A5N6ZP80_9EURO|nr:N-terminal domain of NEFA-interacting nuclear protein NIP30-domain-containing protein [Aspergillus caelatus]KAE8359023.1 N-terminal domain of NEFA-interacting nuclear protein NIP30-domain-containing protein [Aspergillus caelatus]KAE8416283.1 N-terminal domain of NEFA-interacting nuclear protein NIP30-domain-containing protein [Aspergillus pseudocaelatus]